MLSVSNSSPTHLVVSSVARNPLFDNRSPLGLRLGVTSSSLSCRAIARHPSLRSGRRPSSLRSGRRPPSLRVGRHPQGAPSLDSSGRHKKRALGVTKKELGMIKKMFGEKRSSGRQKGGLGITKRVEQKYAS